MIHVMTEDNLEIPQSEYLKFLSQQELVQERFPSLDEYVIHPKWSERISYIHIHFYFQCFSESQEEYR